MITAERTGQMDADCCGDRFPKDVKGGNSHLSQLRVWLHVFVLSVCVCVRTYMFILKGANTISLPPRRSIFRFW